MNRILQQRFGWFLQRGLLLALCSVLGCFPLIAFAQQVSASAAATQTAEVAAQREIFKQAWAAAKRGDHETVVRLSADITDYVLYPYLRYNDFLANRSSVEPAELATFLDAHKSWAFYGGLRRAWLRSLGESGRWDALLQYADPTVDTDTEVLCYRAQAQIQRKQQQDLLKRAQELWAVGRSQPEACDPVFAWLKKNNGITHELAWLRVGRAMQARNSRLTLYLSRYLSSDDKSWLERWQQQDSGAYLRLDKSRSWPDQQRAWEIVSFGIGQLARKDADRAWQLFPSLDDHFHWPAEAQADMLREVALWSAVAGTADATIRMRSVPAAARDDKLLEWWARSGLTTSNWAEVVLAVDEMSPEAKNSDRWQYWDARARIQLGDEPYARTLMEKLATQASYHGFLAADSLGFPYAICPQSSDVSATALAAFTERAEVQRVLELQLADMKNWARSEWSVLTRDLSLEELRLAAAFATRETWYYEAIVALAASGDMKWYDLRFPMAYSALVEKQAGKQGLDSAWVLGLMRSESAMASDAISSADARGLMQVTPATARQIARRNSYSYSGSEQLLQPETNIVFGTTFLRELMDKFNNNPVLVSGAYNAGPGAVQRWLGALPGQDATIWIEVLPYYETRDYIPRVLAFTTIYNYLLGREVQRISSRMPPPDASFSTQTNLQAEVATIACPTPVAIHESGT